jgi:hypothetical protein
MVFGDRDVLGLAVDGRGGAKDEALHVVRKHRVDESDRAVDVVREVAPRVSDRFAGLDVPAVVNHGLEVMGGEEAGQGFLVADVGVDELGVGVNGGEVT